LFKSKARANRNKTNDRFYAIISDNGKLRSLKETLRNDGMVTNIAIQQYLLQHHKSNDNDGCKQGPNKYGSDRSLSSGFQHHNLI